MKSWVWATGGQRLWLRAIAIALAVVAMSMLVACSSSDDNGDGDSSGGAAATASSDDSGSTGDLQEIESTILFEDNVFEPDALTFPVGSKVTFKYENVGLAVHNMIVQSQDVEGENFQSPVAVNPGESGEFEATFTKAGTFEFICVYHQPGMTGTITIE